MFSRSDRLSSRNCDLQLKFLGIVQSVRTFQRVQIRFGAFFELFDGVSKEYLLQMVRILKQHRLPEAYISRSPLDILFYYSQQFLLKSLFGIAAFEWWI
jgi:hypothetical protein